MIVHSKHGTFVDEVPFSFIMDFCGTVTECASSRQISAVTSLDLPSLSLNIKFIGVLFFNTSRAKENESTFN